MQTLSVRASTGTSRQQLLQSLDSLGQLQERASLLSETQQALSTRKDTFTTSISDLLARIEQSYADSKPLSSSDDVNKRVLGKVLDVVATGSKEFQAATPYQSLQAGAVLTPLLEDLEAEVAQTAFSNEVTDALGSLESLRNDLGDYEHQYTRVQHRYEALIETLYEQAIAEGGTARNA